jgi:hypothetical protein
MRRESHRRRRGQRRPHAPAWGHRAIYVGAILAAAAVVTGFGAALLIYAPVGVPYRQLSGGGLGVPPVGVWFGTEGDALATALALTNATVYNPVWNWTNASGAYTGPCNASGLLVPASGTYLPFDDVPTAVPVTSGNVTLVCLNSVGPTFDAPYGGGISATWYADPLGNPLTNNSYNLTNFMANGSTYSNGQDNVTSCNSWEATPPNPSWESPWNLTHIDNATFEPCATYYEQNNNTTWVPSFKGQYLGIFASGVYVDLPDYVNSTVWAPDEFGYGPSDVIYQVSVLFNNTSSTDGIYEISISIGGITPVAQTFYFDNLVHGGSEGPGRVLFVFDQTAAWLFDATYDMTGHVTPSFAPEIYGAVGTVSTIVSECTSDSVCPVQANV